MSKQQSLKRQTISLQSKIKILDSLSGEDSSSVGRAFGLNEATIRTIEKMEFHSTISNFWVST